MARYTIKETFLERLQNGEDLYRSIRDAFQRRGTTMGIFFAIGAVRKATVAFYDQGKKTYENMRFDESAEILSCTGNISITEGDISVHGHIVLGFKDGTTKGGHLLEGTTIFACELFGIILEGEPLERIYDEITGLKLWGC